MILRIPDRVRPGSGGHAIYVVPFANAMRAAGCDVVIDKYLGPPPGHEVFRAMLDDQMFLVDFHDMKSAEPVSADVEGLARFKFSYSACHLPPDHRMFPYWPTSFPSWEKFEETKARIRYGDGDRVLFAQVQHAWAEYPGARTRMYDVIPAAFPGRTDSDARKPIEEYWLDINTCLVRIFVPGSRNDMLDRGHGQYLAFGCCTIAPPISNILPGYERLVAGTHYVQCAADYSDVVDRVRWCERHRAECREIGRNAAALFARRGTPKALLAWVLECVEDWKGHR